MKWDVEGDENSQIFTFLNINMLTSPLNVSTLMGFGVTTVTISNPLPSTIFMSGLKSRNTTYRPSFQCPLFHKLFSLDSHFLDSSFTMDEVKEVVWGCAGSKAPEPDGYNFSFLKA